MSQGYRIRDTRVSDGVKVAVAVLLLTRTAAAAPPGRADLTGTLRLALPGGATSPGADAVVWVAGAHRPAVRSSAQPPAVASRDKRFDPHVLVVTRGATVTFPNVDPIYHNAFSRTPGSEFDLGLYRRGAARAFTFRSAGLVRLYCNIHAEMAAYVLVLDPEDAFAVADAAGSFRLADLPAGRQVVHVWSEKGGEKELTIDVGAEGAAPLEVVLDASSYQPMPHKNKFGKDYPPATQGVDRY
jgi:plastocyanin